LINQRALPCSGRTGQAENAGAAGLGKYGFQQVCPAGAAVLDHADSTRQGASIAVVQAVEPGLEIGGQELV